ncbi:MAG TPA: phosphotransferase [Streptosporangiaceae bacterium]|nr:phosphotransferase [Streptosporangiaceae bacterium]
MTEPRTARLDAQPVADAVRDRTGVPLVIEGPCPGGQVGAAYVRWPDGRRGVLTWRPGVTLDQVSNGPLAVPALLRATGYPAPATQLAVQISDGVAMVQERLAGTAVEHVDTALLDQALALIGQHAGALAGHPEVPALPRYLRADGPGYCLHGPLGRFSPRAARLERRIAAIGGRYPDRPAGDDVVHGDFHHENLLAQDGRLTGVVDWDGAGRGDRRFDLVSLRFGLRPDNSTVAARARLEAILDQFPAEVLTPAWAHMSLRMADWAIRHFDPADVPYWLDLAETRL